MKTFIKTVIDRLNIGANEVHVGAVIYSSGASVVFPLNKHYTAESAKAAIQAMPYIGGGTNTQLGLSVSLKMLFMKS